MRYTQRLAEAGAVASAVVDRLTFRGHIIATGTDSYRLRVTRAAKKGATT